MTYILRCLRPGWDVPSTGMMAHQFVIWNSIAVLCTAYIELIWYFLLEILLHCIYWCDKLCYLQWHKPYPVPLFVSRCGTAKCVVTKRTGSLSLSFLCPDVYKWILLNDLRYFAGFFYCAALRSCCKDPDRKGPGKFWHRFLRSGECRWKWTISTSPSLDKQYISFRRRKWFAP